MKCYSQNLVILVTLLLIITIIEALEDGPTVIDKTVVPLGCHRRLYTIKITQVDGNGYECWDHVSVLSCWGRCDSNEISDWKFPYKKSHHPVCVHAGRNKAVAILRNCHPLADPETRKYEYMEAKACHCQTCSSTDTSCEAPKLIHGGVKVLQLAGPGPDDLEY